MYLTYRELFTIHAICEWCVSSAVLMTLLLILTADPALCATSPRPALAPTAHRDQPSAPSTASIGRVSWRTTRAAGRAAQPRRWR